MDCKKALNSDLFEAMMKRALIERYMGEVDRLKTESADEPFSESLDKKARKIIRKVGRKEQLINVARLSAKSLAIALMVLGITFGIMLTQPKVYAAVWDVVRTAFEDHDSYSSNIVSSDMDDKTFDNSIVPSYIPEGYKLRQAFYGDYDVNMIYENIDDEDIHYSYGAKEGAEIFINNERVEFSERLKDGITYYDYKSKMDDYNTVIWYKGDYYFELKSQLPIDEIVKIAESVLEVQ